jgi:hypothetical protein
VYICQLIHHRNYLVLDRSLYIEFKPELRLVILVTITAVDDTKSILVLARQELSKPLLAPAKIYIEQIHVFSWREVSARGLEFMKNILLVIYAYFRRITVLKSLSECVCVCCMSLRISDPM